MSKYLIWSEEHGAWWRAGGTGYTRYVKTAGRYSLEAAQQICMQANEYLVAGVVHEIAFPVPESLAGDTDLKAVTPN